MDDQPKNETEAQQRLDTMLKTHGEESFRRFMDNPMTRVLYEMVAHPDVAPQQLAALLKAAHQAGCSTGAQVFQGFISETTLTMFVKHMDKGDANG